MRRLEHAPTDLVIMDLRSAERRLANPIRGKAWPSSAGIRDLGYRAPVIVLCGWPEDLYGQPEEQLVSRILLKPVRTHDFLNTIRDLLAAAT